MSETSLKDYVEKSNSTILERFWNKVLKTDGCWFWTGAKYIGGYGAFGLGPKGSGNIYAHRFSYFLKHGKLPKAGKLLVCHKCDIPNCVNPDHLFLTTQYGNMLDMRLKERHPHGNTHGSKTHPENWARGEKVGTSKLKKEDVLKIRSLWDTGKYTQRKLGKMYGLNPRGAIHFIIKRKTWAHV